MRHAGSAHYDAVVFGCGPAACVFAIRMIGHGKSVLMLPPRHRSNRKSRGETLSPRGEFLLNQMGVAARCLAFQQPTNSVLSCWRSPLPEKIDLAFDPHGRMWHINRQAFDEALVSCAAHLGVYILDRNTHGLRSIDRTAAGWHISLDSERSVTATYLTDASGTSYFLARHMGAKRVFHDRLITLSTIAQQTHDTTALLIEPVSRGWWYSLGLSDGKLLLALITDPTLEKLSPKTRKSVWNAMLDEAPHTKKRAETLADLPDVASVESACLDHMSGDGWVAVGDSAMTLDPLSSHGLCNAIEQAMEAADILSVPEKQNGLAAFDLKRRSLFEKYRTQRIGFYQSVRRFSQFAFWQNRIVH